MGAQAVQIGTRFAATEEASSHPNFKQAILEAEDTSTVLVLKTVAPVRLKKNPFALAALEAQRRGASKEEELALLGAKRERAGIFDGDLVEGELEMGQSAALIHDLPPAAVVIERLISEYRAAAAAIVRIG